MRKWGLLAAIGTLAFAPAAHARITAGHALLRAGALTQVKAQLATGPTCPAGVPVQTITVVNQANVQPKALALVERAVSDQSMQLRAAWGTPCVEFGPGGWPLTMTTGTPMHNPDGSTSYVTSGEHCGALGDPRLGTCYSAEPSMSVQTATLSYTIWVRAFSHEVDEALVDSTDAVWAHPGELEEICDPVENVTYPLDGVQVSDFAFPTYFNGGAGPWDEMGVLTGPVPANIVG